MFKPLWSRQSLQNKYKQRREGENHAYNPFLLFCTYKRHFCNNVLHINKWRRQYKHTKMSMNAECFIPPILSLHLRLPCLLFSSCFLSAQSPILLSLLCYPTAKIPWFLFRIVIKTKTTVISSLWNFVVKKLVRRPGEIISIETVTSQVES